MKGYLPDATDWQTKLSDGRILAVGFFSYGEDANLNCVLQKDANNGADSAVDFQLVHELSDFNAKGQQVGADALLKSFIDEANIKLTKVLGGDKPAIPTELYARLLWHFRYSLSFNSSTNKIVFTAP